MKKIVYVTGCLGFIGSHITRACLDRGWYVRGVDKCTYATNKRFLDDFFAYDNFEWENEDINDIEFLYDCDYIINTAAETHVDNSILKSEEFIHSNINGVHRLLELIRLGRQHIKPILLHFSTDEVYGDIESGSFKETDLLHPSNPYAATKAAGDMMILAWARTYKVPYVIVRPTNNYGIGQYVEKLIPRTCKYLQIGRKIPLHNEGKPTRNWLHASDTANAIMTIIDSGRVNEIFNIAGHFEQSNIETVCKILEVFGYDRADANDFIIHETRPGNDIRYAVDDSKLMSLGWYPKIEFDKALPLIVGYYRNNFIW